MPEHSLMKKARRKFRRAQLLGTKAIMEGVRGLTGHSLPEQTVFVAGAQRSGTNMVMNVLDRSFHTRVYHERDPRAFDEYLMREPEVIKRLHDSAKAPVFVIKSLCEMEKLPGLMEAFSPAKTIWMIRNYDDMVNSAMKIFAKLPRDVVNILEDPESEDWRGRGISGETLALMRSIHHPGMNDETRVAMFWYMRNQMFFDHEFEQNPQVLPVMYERLVTNPQREFQRLFDFIGIPYSPRISRFVTARSVRKEGAPDVDAGVRELCDGLLERLQPHCEAPVGRFRPAKSQVA